MYFMQPTKKKIKNIYNVDKCNDLDVWRWGQGMYKEVPLLYIVAM